MIDIQNEIRTTLNKDARIDMQSLISWIAGDRSVCNVTGARNLEGKYGLR